LSSQDPLREREAYFCLLTALRNKVFLNILFPVYVTATLALSFICGKNLSDVTFSTFAPILYWGLVPLITLF